MNWKNITLGQFQDIHKLTLDTQLDEIERAARLISIVYGKTEHEVDELSITEFNRLAKACQFLQEKVIPGKPVRSFRVGLKRYAINYKPTTLRHRQYVEILHFSENPIANMHLILASLVYPVKYGFRTKNKVEDHSRIAAEMLNAPFVPVYNSCVFFCKLYRDLIERIQGFLIADMMKQGATTVQAKKLVSDSINAMDGFIQQSK